jgi:uncharacterized protein (DUF433 family)
MPELTRITRDPTVMGGKPCIRGMRVTVGTVVGLVAVGRTRDEILREYPYLEAEDIAEDHAEGRFGGDAECGQRHEEVARYRRPHGPNKRGCGGGI